MASETSENSLKSSLEFMALPHWFTDQMVDILLPDRSQEERQNDLDRLINLGQVEYLPGLNRYRVKERLRVELVQTWMSDGDSEVRRIFEATSELLADFCEKQAKAATNPNERDEWRIEQLYHLAVVEPGRAIQLMKNWFERAVEKEFNLNQGHRWLLPLEERREWLAELEKRRKRSPGWLAELTRLREYLTARSFWSEEWYKSINYLPRKQLIEQLDDFFSQRGNHAPWMLNLHAPGGHGKSATIDWLLARYALPRGYICTRFDYDALSRTEQAHFFENPEMLLPYLASNLNAQRSRKIEAFERQTEQRDDPVASFTIVLRETFAENTVVIFIDTLETLLDNAAEPLEALEKLLRMLARIQNGDLENNGSLMGFNRLRVVLAGRHSLKKRYSAALDRVFGTSKHQREGLPLVEFKLSGFNLEEGNEYLSQKRKLTDQTRRLITPILQKAAQLSASELNKGTGAGKGQATAEEEAEIIPLKLALYADLVKEEPDISPEQIARTDQIDLVYLVNRILKHIQDPAIHWLLRYGVIFRRLDADAAGVLLPFLEKALSGRDDLDDPSLDPQEVREALEASRQQESRFELSAARLLEQLTRYSWVEQQGNYISFHPDIARTQLQIISRQKIFGALQQAAFEHYRDHLQTASTPKEKAELLREAVFHSLQTDNAGPQFWREQFQLYRTGPGILLWALVDEATHVEPELAKRHLTREDYFQAYLALANCLLSEIEQPFMPDQLETAEEAAGNALELAENENERFQARLISARVLLERRKLDQALAKARACMEQATTDEQKVSALQVLGLAEAANSLWARALSTVKDAYAHSVKILGLGKPLAPADLSQPDIKTHKQVRLDLIGLLLETAEWREAIPLIAEARAEEPDEPVVLEKAARLAFKQARLEEARELYRRAVMLSSGKQAERLSAGQQMVEIHQGDVLAGSLRENGGLAVIAAAARADWTLMESLLRARLPDATTEEALEIINSLLHYYLEVSGDWRQVKVLLERGERWSKRRPETDPSLARFNVLRQYFEFMTSQAVLTPEAASAEGERRMRQALELVTPEERVRAKGYLLIARFFGALRYAHTESEREAVSIYQQYAGQALEKAFELLPNLPPIDQVDIMRTMAVLPGWSSSIVNDVGPDPAERSALLLLQQSFESNSGQQSLTFLTRLAAHFSRPLSEYLQVLETQISSGESDWPLLYTSFGRLLSACGQTGKALEFINHPRSLETEVRQSLPVPVIVDRAFIAEWDIARDLLESTITRLENVPGASRLVNELMLVWAYQGLIKGATIPHLNTVSIWLSRLFALPFINPGNMLFLEEYYLLQAITAYKLDALEKTRKHLDEALSTAEGLGNSYAIELIRAAEWQLEMEQSVRRQDSPIPQAPEAEIAEPTPEVKQLELALFINQLDAASLELVLISSDRPETIYKTQSRLAGSKHLLPQGKKQSGLPSLDYWQKLLSPDTNLGLEPEVIGATLLNDLLPLRSRARKRLMACLQDASTASQAGALRVVVQGQDVEYLPWEILYEAETATWLGQRFRLTRNRLPEESFELRGSALLVRPVLQHSEADTLAQTVETFYRPASDGKPRENVRQVYGPDLLAQNFLSELVGITPDLPFPVKVFHLLGDLRKPSEEEGIFLSMGRVSAETLREHLTPDALAHQLRLLGINRSLLILEPLPTGSDFEDLRVLLLRNFYAASLARLGNWVVLCTGPDHSVAAWLSQLLDSARLLPVDLEEVVRQATLQNEKGALLTRGWPSLFYPAL
ncbi:MAG TPA: hypothetical protein VH186_22575 [Chloroflexia bacterium]|nr:hypothetical protein [Chloroflexia bacterium]